MSEALEFKVRNLHEIPFNIVTILVTYKMGFGLDDWIYCTLYIHNSGTTGNTALPLFYTFSNSPFYTL
jgi:hypothetical protein